jgi:hypothetical protein
VADCRSRPPIEEIAGHLLHPPDLTMLPDEERPAVAHALAKDPAERWPSCRAFVEALRLCDQGGNDTETAAL